jgi:hypothetical protein
MASGVGMAEAECAGEIGSGFPLAALAAAAGIPAALFASSALTACAAAGVARPRSRARRPGAPLGPERAGS